MTLGKITAGALALAMAGAVAAGPAVAGATATAGAPQYPAHAAGRVVPWPYRDSYAHLCHAWQAGAYAVFTSDHGRRAFAARCERLADGSGRYAWSELQS